MTQSSRYHQNGAAIRAIRQRDGMPLKVLAERVGIHRQSLSHIELDNKPASPELLALIAKELRVELAAITLDGRNTELAEATSGGQ